MDFAEFQNLAKDYNVISVNKEIIADLITPVVAYKLIESSESFLLESVEKGEHLSRYSFLSADPYLIYKAKNNQIQLIYADGTKEEKVGNPLDVLQELLGQFKIKNVEGMPPLIGGAVGYFSYDCVRYIEVIPDDNPDKLNCSDIYLMFPAYILAFDHVKHTIKIIYNVYLDKKTDIETQYNNAISQLKIIEEKIVDSSHNIQAIKIEEADVDHTKIKSNYSFEKYEEIVNKAKQYIKIGDIFQVVPSQRFEQKLARDPFDVYRRLRIINPAPYMFYYQTCESVLIGSSPEILVRREGNKVLVRPIAGTRKRGKNQQEDLELIADLLADEKEKAEHVMLVDLGRNDLGRICKYGTVKTTNFMSVEKYSHVIHLVSNVEGELSDLVDGVDVLKATFPAGTLTGSPKIRAMEIIDELENVKRGIYGGVLGYIGFNGNVDLCITIRTIVVKNGVAYVQAGGGVVADSIAENEYMETVNKAKGMLKAL